MRGGLKRSVDRGLVVLHESRIKIVSAVGTIVVMTYDESALGRSTGFLAGFLANDTVADV